MLACRVWGSNPPARIEWFSGDAVTPTATPLRVVNASHEDGGNVTVSHAVFVPAAGSTHQTITCRGTNDELLGGAPMGGATTPNAVEDHVRIEVFCKSNTQCGHGRNIGGNEGAAN